jgi:glycosyltransferase involved in cell wall biosynthesis
MTATIGIVANVYNEANTLPGWLEMATSFADWVGVMHAGPNKNYSHDGTLEILQKWRVPVQFCAIDEGFGVVRTKTLRMCPAGIDWVMLLDADERFHRFVPVLTCSGESTPPEVVDDLLYDYGNPNFAKDGPRNRQVVQSYDGTIDFGACPSNFENLALLGAKLKVQVGLLYSQGMHLRRLIEDELLDAVTVVRRHWHDFTFARPTQNWHTDPDYQMRVLRNKESIYFAQDTRMHERVVGAERVYRPDFTCGPFFDHYHIPFKRMEPDQRRHDVEIYGAIDRGEEAPTWEKFRK